MKVSSGFLIAVSVIALLGVGAYRWHEVNTVSAKTQGSTSEFFRTYDPGPVLRRYGTERARTSGTSSALGWHEATRKREMTATIALDATQVADLGAALRNDVDTKLRAQGRLIGWGADSGEYDWEYESDNAWGFFVLESIEPEPSKDCPVANIWRVRMRFIERWHQ
jgi:hypothetical protein